MECIKDADYMHAKRVCQDFEIKNVGQYHDSYLKSDTLLLADIFENFKKMRLKIYQLDPAKFLSAPALANSFKKYWSKIRIINWYWYAINGWICYWWLKKELEEYVTLLIDNKS